MSYSPAAQGDRMRALVQATSYLGVMRDLRDLGTALASAVWPAANRAIYVPLYVSNTVTVVKMFSYNGNTASGNLDIGLYSAAGTRLVSQGSTAMAGTVAMQAFDIADTLLTGPAMYYMALAVDNVTAAMERITSIATVGHIKLAGVLQQDSAFPLPSTMTPAALTAAYVPNIGVSLRTLLG